MLFNITLAWEKSVHTQGLLVSMILKVTQLPSQRRVSRVCISVHMVLMAGDPRPMLISRSSTVVITALVLPVVTEVCMGVGCTVAVVRGWYRVRYVLVQNPRRYLWRNFERLWLMGNVVLHRFLKSSCLPGQGNVLFWLPVTLRMGTLRCMCFSVWMCLQI